MKLEKLTLVLDGYIPVYLKTKKIKPNTGNTGSLLEDLDPLCFDALARFSTNVLAGPFKGASLTYLDGEEVFKVFLKRSIPNLLLVKEQSQSVADRNLDQGEEGANVAKNVLEHNRHTETEVLGLDLEQ